MKAMILVIAILLAGCAAAPVKGCGYARSQQKKLDRYHRHHRHR